MLKINLSSETFSWEYLPIEIDREKRASFAVEGTEIAKCYEALSDNDLALEYLDKVVSIFPDNEEAHEMIRKLS